jgi:F-type H+-transporting ATPase subunit alpha
MAELTISADDIQSAIEEYVESFTSDTSREEVGTVVDAGDGIAHVDGLPSVMMQELLEFTGGVLGVALNLDEHNIGTVVLGDFQKIEEGQQVKRTGEVLSVPVGDGYLGRVVDPLGHPIDGGGDIETDARRVLELQAPSVINRQGVKEPLQTGIKAIDAMTPIGRGQRQLIIGDRKTGKTAVCVDTILNQRKNWETDDEKKQVRCVYVAVGQKGTTIAAVRQALEEGGAMDYTTIVAAPASDSAGFKWLAPYTGSAIAQHWMYAGKHVLIVFDDLTKHADAYRAISLLLRRPPGREAFPGDVFYLHSRLLERCAKLSDELGGGSLTALPVIETKANDISAYIPTNVISITDGQCFLESDLFNQGVRPAINVGSSVSRVGGAAQIKAMKEVSGSLRLDLSQYRELESFAAFASDLDDTSKKQLARGERLVELLKQPQYRPMPIEQQVVAIFLGTGGHLDSVPVEDIKRFEAELLDHMKASEEGFLENIRKSEKLSEEEEEKLVDIIDHFKKGFSASGGGSVVPDEHVDAMDEDEVGKESVQVKKEKPKDKDSKKNSKKDSGESTKASGDSKKASKDSEKDKK